MHPSHDLAVPGPDGERKISGNAQHRPREAVVQHGSLLYSDRTETHLACFADAPVDAAEFRSRVTSIVEQTDIERGEAIETLELTLREWFDAVPGEWADEERDRAEALVDEKFDAAAWVRRRADVPVEE